MTEITPTLEYTARRRRAGARPVWLLLSVALVASIPPTLVVHRYRMGLKRERALAELNRALRVATQPSTRDIQPLDLWGTNSVLATLPSVA